MSIRKIRDAVAASILIASSATGGVIVVDATGAGDVGQIQDAIDVALDGDTILVKSGTYGNFNVDNKDLRIVADQSATIAIYSHFSNVPNGIRVTSPSKSVIVRGIKGYYHVFDSQGIVRFENTSLVGGGATCTLSGGGLGGGMYVCGEPYAAARVTNSTRVEFVRCTITGGQGGAVDVSIPGCVPGGDGLVATNSKIVLYDSSYAGGAVLPPHAGCGPGDAFVGDPTQLTTFDGPENFKASSPLRTGQLGALSIGGLPGDAVLMLLSAKPSHLALPPHVGMLMVAPPILGVFAFGTMPGSGTVDIPITIQDLSPSGIDVVDLHLQPVLVGANGIGKFAPPALITMLSPSF